jgi:ApaG protein
MVALTTKGIKITVESHFQPAHSEPHRERYLHVYNIQIENKNEFAVQLLRRHWFIIEGAGIVKEVEGEGVIGQKPIIQPGGFHAYSSYCVLADELGKMQGTYLMKNIDDDTTFQADIPSFVLIHPPKLN